MRSTALTALILAALLLVLGSSCTHPRLAPSFSAASEDGAGASGWYYVCHFEEHHWHCPAPRGLVFATREEAEADLRDHLRRFPAHDRASRLERHRCP